MSDVLDSLPELGTGDIIRRCYELAIESFLKKSTPLSSARAVQAYIELAKRYEKERPFFARQGKDELARVRSTGDNELLRIAHMQEATLDALVSGAQIQTPKEDNAAARLLELRKVGRPVYAADRLDGVWVVDADRYGIIERNVVYKKLTPREVAVHEAVARKKEILFPSSILLINMPDGSVIEVMERVSVKTVFSWMHQCVEKIERLNLLQPSFPYARQEALNARKIGVLRRGLVECQRFVDILSGMIPDEFVLKMNTAEEYIRYVQEYISPKYELESAGHSLRTSGILEHIIIPHLVAMPRRLSRDLNQGNVFTNGVQIDTDVLVKEHDLSDTAMFLEPFGLSEEELLRLVEGCTPKNIEEQHGGVEGLLRDFNYASWWSSLGRIAYYQNKKYQLSIFGPKTRENAPEEGSVAITLNEERTWLKRYNLRIRAHQEFLYSLASRAAEKSTGSEKKEWQMIEKFMRDATFTFKKGPYRSGKELLSKKL